MTNYRNTQGESSHRESYEQPAIPHLERADLKQLAGAVQEVYRNFVVCAVNSHCVRMAVMEGEYRWHYHPHSDECFLTLEGTLEIDLQDGRTLHLRPGETFTVPAGVVHRTRSHARSVNLCFEHQSAYTDVVFVEQPSTPTATD